MQSFTSIDYEPSLDIRNVGSLPACKGAKFLLCIFGITEDVLIAKSWHRKYPNRKAGEVVVFFRDENYKATNPPAAMVEGTSDAAV